MRASWRSSPLTQVRSARSSGSGTSSAVVTQGPNGQEVSKPFARVHCDSRPWRSRALTSSATTKPATCAAGAQHDPELALVVQPAHDGRAADRAAGRRHRAS